uniref:Uncharacterized protein n=1 Tax=Arundo donax TaxID=35708 RepID=A0A0A8Z9K3_ARUDO
MTTGKWKKSQLAGIASITKRSILPAI